jgi:TRAP-type C4-dicarboxylate transport system permease small subunit
LPLNMSWAQFALPLGWGLMIIRIMQRVQRRFFPKQMLNVEPAT